MTVVRMLADAATTRRARRPSLHCITVLAPHRLKTLYQIANANRIGLAMPMTGDRIGSSRRFEQDGDNVITHGVASARAIVGIDAAFIRHQFDAVRTLRADNSGNQERNRDQDADDGEEEKDGNVILRHEPSTESR